MSPELGTQLGGYRIDGVVGRGGMGVVYRATEVALDHPGILPVYAAGEADGKLYLATRFVDGIDLRELVERAGPLPAERALTLVGQVADALDEAHARNLVHRDVKPGNVLVDASDHCYLCDFGLTKQLGVGATTVTGGLAGSLDYLAPEQIRRGEVDGRADVYALACVLYECLAGAPPFRHETEAQTLWAHMQEPPAPLPTYPELDRVFARALAKDPDERYESCNAFVEDARAALGLGPSRVAVRRRRGRVGRRLLVAGAALLAAAGAATILVVTLGSRDRGLVAPPNSVALVDPVSLKPVAAVPVGNTPTETAASSRWIWVVNSNDGAGTISRIDGRTRRVASTFSVGGTPKNIVAAFGSLWVGTSEGQVFRVEPGTDLVEKSWRLPNAGESTAFAPDPGAGWLAAGPDAIWAASTLAISRIDLATSRLSPTRSSIWGPMAYGFGSVWVADDENGAVVRVDPRQEAVLRTYDVGGRPFGLAVGAGALWAASDDGSVARIDPRSDTVESITIGGAPRNVGFAPGGIWVSVD